MFKASAHPFCCPRRALICFYLGCFNVCLSSVWDKRNTEYHDSWLHLYRARSKITQLLIPTHAHFHWLKFIKKTSKKLLHVSVYDHHQGVIMSLPKSLLLKHSCMYAKRGGVAAYHIVRMESSTALARTRTPGTLLKYKPIQTIWYAATLPRLVYIQLWFK